MEMHLLKPLKNTKKIKDNHLDLPAAAFFFYLLKLQINSWKTTYSKNLNRPIWKYVYFSF